MTQWSRKLLYSQTVMGWKAPQNGLDSALRHHKRGKLGLEKILAVKKSEISPIWIRRK
jgi:hypothetical protein